MEIILLESIYKLGNIGDKVKVKDGYGRNFLLKQGKALRFNEENQNLVLRKKEELIKKNKATINKKVFTFFKESKENGDLYGSIKPKEITNQIKEKMGVEVSPSQIDLKKDLNTIGKFEVNVNFHSEVKAVIFIKIDKIQTK